MFTYKNSLEVLSLFTDGYNKQLHVREVARLIKISPRTAMLILDELSKKGVLDYDIKGKNKVYQLKSNEISEYILALAESHKKAVFLDKHFKIAIIVSKLKVDGVAAIFGSYAKAIQKKDSDLDIFISGKYNKEEIDEYQKIISLKLDIKNYPKGAFDKPDILTKEVIKHHIIIEGQESFVKSILSVLQKSNWQ